MKPARPRTNREELRKEAERLFIPEDAENPFADWREVPFKKPKLPCHVPNCNDPMCEDGTRGRNEKAQTY